MFSADCNGSPVATWLGAIFLSLACSAATADETGKPRKSQPPALSLESLFHPEHKSSYVSPLPQTHWIGGEQPELLVRRDNAWMRLDLSGREEQSREESPWPIFDSLIERLSMLEGVQIESAKRAAIDAVAKMKRSLDPVLVKIDESMAVVSADTPARWLTRDAKNWRNATIDPRGRIVAYNRDGDLFLMDAANERTLQLTDDGSDTLLDGILDWTYQEEIFGRGNYKGFWFSPNGNWLAMLRIDISGIAPYTLAAADSPRGEGIVRRYPKAGDPIPHASLLLWDLRQFKGGVVPPPRLLAESNPQQQQIVTGVWWHEHRGELLFSVSDRRQTWRELRLVTEDILRGTGAPARPSDGRGMSGNGLSRLLLREESSAWVEPPVAPGWLKDGGIVWRSELPAGLNRLYHLSRSGTIVTPLSPVDFDVQDFMVRADGDFAIVTGSTQTGPGQRHAYRIDLDLAADETPKLIPITTKPGWHSTTPSPGGEFVTDVYSTEVRPPGLWVRSATADHSTLIERSELAVDSDLVRPDIFRIPTDSGIGLPAMIVRPPSASGKHPCAVVVEVYGGPQSPVVSTRWSDKRTLYRELLARRGIATLVVDNRSSAGRGIVDTWAVRGRLGELELEDLQVAVEWLKSQAWVDEDRLAIRGWSFGGFLTLYAMTHSDAFAAGIAGGSVTDWREYDAFYTERYMDLPSENPDGYQATSPLAAAANLSGRVLLIHGESDDNVHPSGTMRMAAALQQAGKGFDLMLYPGAAHAISDPWQSWHMTRMTDQFLADHLLPSSN
jgi:dipeptidyl-peptidase-4